MLSKLNPAGLIGSALFFTTLCAAGLVSGTAKAQGPPNIPNIQTTDYLVPHISTVPANASQRVELFVREKVGSGRRGRRGEAPVVLMIGGATISAVPAFDLQFESYSWMEYLATA